MLSMQFLDATVLDMQNNTQDLTTLLVGVFAGLLILAFVIGFLVARAIGSKAERAQRKAEKEAEKQAKKQAKADKASAKKNKNKESNLATALDTSDGKNVSSMPIIPDRTSSIKFDDDSNDTLAVPVVPVKAKKRVTNDVEKSQHELKARAAAAAEERKIEEVKKANELHEAERGAIVAARAAAKAEEAENTATPAEPQLSKSEFKKQKKAEARAKKEADKKAALEAKEAEKAAALKAKEDAKQAKLDAKLAKKNKKDGELQPTPAVVPEAPVEEAAPLTAEEMAKRLEALVGPAEPISFGAEEAETTVEEGAVEAPVQPGLEEANDSDSLPTFDSNTDALPAPVADDVLPTAMDTAPVEANALPSPIDVAPSEEDQGDEDNWVLEEARRMAAEKPIEEKKPELPFAFSSGVESSADDVELSNKQKKKIKEKEEAAEKAKAEREAKAERKKGFSLFGSKHEEEEEIVVEDDFDESYMGEEIPDSLAGFGFSAAPVLKNEDEEANK